MQPTIEARDLHFHYSGQTRQALRGVDFVGYPGMRCLLIGANGAGKTTLLRVIAGKHMVPHEAVRVLGTSAFHDTRLADRVELIAGRFGFEVDLTVQSIVDGVRGVEPARRQRLFEMLEVDPEWRMHAVSDGQRRRVQILLSLLRPSEVLLLDEVTTDLDVLARGALLEFLRSDVDSRGTTVLYATHIFDGLEDWATHLAYMHAGRITYMAALDAIEELTALRRSGVGSPILRLVEGWLRRDRPR